MNHNPDIHIDLTHKQQAILTAGNNLERQLMKLHRHYHGHECETCQALLTWWDLTGR